MPLLFPNAGEADFLAIGLGKKAFGALTLRLYSNNYTPTEATVAGDFVEVAGGGYAAKALVGANWVIAEGAPTEASYPQQEFLFNGDAPDAYGYYVQRADGVVVYAERFPDGPYVIAADGDSIKVTPKVTLD